MPFPRRTPRDRMQLMIRREVARRLRAYCKRHRLELSAFVSDAIDRQLIREHGGVVVPVELHEPGDGQ